MLITLILNVVNDNVIVKLSQCLSKCGHAHMKQRDQSPLFYSPNDKGIVPNSQLLNYVRHGLSRSNCV